MSKYYVQCGRNQLITTADDPFGAALWAMHRWMVSASEVSPWPLVAVMPSEPEIRVSEIGFGCDDGALLETADVWSEWQLLWMAVGRMETGSRTCCMLCE